jgi:predicted nucleic acid-binding protein
MTKILYFDTNAVVKYFHDESGSDVIKWIINNRVLKSISISTGQQTIDELPRVLRKKALRGEISPKKAQIIIDQAHRIYFPQIFRVRDDKLKPGFNDGADVELDKLCAKYNLKKGKNDWDAFHLMCVINYLRCFGGISKPRVVTSDINFKKIIEGEGYQVIDPQNISIIELEILLEKEP